MGAIRQICFAFVYLLIWCFFLYVFYYCPCGHCGLGRISWLIICIPVCLPSLTSCFFPIKYQCLGTWRIVHEANKLIRSVSFLDSLGLKFRSQNSRILYIHIKWTLYCGKKISAFIVIQKNFLETHFVCFLFWFISIIFVKMFGHVGFYILKIFFFKWFLFFFFI